MNRLTFAIAAIKGKCNYYTELIHENQSDPKGLGKKFYSVFQRTLVAVLPKDVSDSSLANRFSTFFIEKISKIRSTFPSLSHLLHLIKMFCFLQVLWSFEWWRSEDYFKSSTKSTHGQRFWSRITLIFLYSLSPVLLICQYLKELSSTSLNVLWWLHYSSNLSCWCWRVQNL